VKALDQRNDERKQELDELAKWRNAVAHQDFDPEKLAGRTMLRLDDVNRWRQACDQLAEGFDVVTAKHLEDLLGAHQW
jgi:hypothetical protein